MDINMPKHNICPHCRRGHLHKTEPHLSWQFNCDVCSRGWVVLDGKYWLAYFDAGGHVYEVDKDGNIKDRNSFSDKLFREKLWKRVREK